MTITAKAGSNLEIPDGAVIENKVISAAKPTRFDTVNISGIYFGFLSLIISRISMALETFKMADSVPSVYMSLFIYIYIYI